VDYADDLVDVPAAEAPGPASKFQQQCAVDLLDCIGTPRFATVLERMLDSMCGPVPFASYSQCDGKVSRIAGHLGEDKALRAWHDLDSNPAGSFTATADSRVSIRHGIASLRGWHGRIRIGLMIECTPDPSHRVAALDVLDALERRSDLLLIAHAKHVELLESRESAIRALASVARIEECLTASGMLTTREIEVCSRIVYGLSTFGIAVDLSLSEETVRTYRKRAYQRLALGTERQLLTWYLRQWTHWNAGAVIAGAPTTLRPAPAR
jgi:DNA-binding CsgD family transcriptional regulator